MDSVKKNGQTHPEPNPEPSLKPNPEAQQEPQSAPASPVPTPRATLLTLLRDMERLGRETAFVNHLGLRRYRTRYGEVAELAHRFATELARREIKPGERVLLWGANSAAWVAGLYGCMLRGVIAVPLDAAGSTGFVERIVGETTPRLIVGDRERLARLQATLPQIDLSDCATTLPASNPELPPVEITPDTPVQIVFTSGTTSEPKGIVHTHRNILSSLAPIEQEIARYRRYERWVHPLRFLNTLPLSHVFGQFISLWIPPLLGAEVHFDERLEAGHLIQTIRRERISVLSTVPRVLELLRNELLERYPALDRELQTARNEPIWRRWWRFRKIHIQFGYKFWAAICGGASLAPGLESFWTTLGFAVIQGYGMTESSALITLNHPFRPSRGSIGKVMPGREVKLGEDGEILVRGPMISKATWRNGQLRPNASEWLATGDLAKRDEAENLLFTGRKNQLIVTASGMNVHPEDIEAVLRQQPGVADCAVLARPTQNADSGTEPAAILLFRGSPQAAQEAILASNAQLADYQRIRYWRLWPELDLPRTATGKVERRTLVAWLKADAASSAQQSTAAQAHQQPLHQDPLLRLLLTLCPQTPTEPSDASRLEEDFGLDSLGRVQLAEKIESALGHTLPEARLETLATLGELRHALQLSAESLPAQHEPSQNAGPPPETAAIPPVQRATAPGKTAPRNDLYPHWPERWPARLVRWLFVEALMRPLVWILARPHIKTAKSLASKPKTQSEPMLMIVNHINNYDVALALSALPTRLRHRTTIAMAADLLADWRARRGEDLWLPALTGPITYWLVTLLFHVFPLPRNAGFRRSFEHAGRALDRGWNVMIFPEGHQTGGELASFRPGIGLLVEQTNAAVLPVALTGFGSAQPQNEARKGGREKTVSVRIGEPMRFATGTPATTITQELHAAMRRLIEASNRSNPSTD